MDPSALPKAFLAIHKYPPKSLGSRLVILRSICNEYSFIGVSDISYLTLGMRSPPVKENNNNNNTNKNKNKILLHFIETKIRFFFISFKILNKNEIHAINIDG